MYWNNTMEDFVRLYLEVDHNNSVKSKTEALVRYFKNANDSDATWAYALLAGRTSKRHVSSVLLRQWAAERSGLPDWLVDESYHIVGDLAETLALILPVGEKSDNTNSLCFWMLLLVDLRKKDAAAQKEHILEAWQNMDFNSRFVFNKLITGGFRMGVSQNICIKALAEAYALRPETVAHRLMGNWNPADTSLRMLLTNNENSESQALPYPFFLAHALPDDVSTLGSFKDWQAEWKWDGIRGQLIYRNGKCFIWSRGEELINEQFPELLNLGQYLPQNTVLDGEIVLLKEGSVRSFQHLQSRLGRKKVSKKTLSELPAALIAYDILECDGKDVRHLSLKERRKLLENSMEKVPSALGHVSPLVHFTSWRQLAELRNHARYNNSEGLMLKHLESPYRIGRKRGDWWKWKVDPFIIDAVLIYAMQGHGRRSNLFTDYTFAVWQDGRLQPFAKAYSGLSDKEIAEVDAFVKKNTLEKFGPVRSVKPELVFELAFEGIQKSMRHKAGIAVRFPRINRWRKDKKAEEADSLDTLKNMIPQND
jgi:DNA ligase-1